MGAESLGRRIGQPISQANHLLQLHRETYRKFWDWSDACVDYAMLRGELHTVFGWSVLVDPNTNPRMLRNFPMQANGAEMLRLACCLTTEHGIQVCAPIHDAILIAAPLDELESRAVSAQELMAQASEAVLGGFRLRSEAKVFHYPERFLDERGEKMWQIVMEVLGGINAR